MKISPLDITPELMGNAFLLLLEGKPTPEEKELTNRVADVLCSQKKLKELANATTEHILNTIPSCHDNGEVCYHQTAAIIIAAMCVSLYMCNRVQERLVN
jgi:hypothetical protein